jgi:hypothetical protein
MLKIILALVADWSAYRRAISGAISVWPVETRAQDL